MHENQVVKLSVERSYESYKRGMSYISKLPCGLCHLTPAAVFKALASCTEHAAFALIGMDESV
jgi:hypothetical protein